MGGQLNHAIRGSFKLVASNSSHPDFQNQCTANNFSDSICVPAEFRLTKSDFSEKTPSVRASGASRFTGSLNSSILVLPEVGFRVHTFRESKVCYLDDKVDINPVEDWTHVNFDYNTTKYQVIYSY